MIVLSALYVLAVWALLPPELGAVDSGFFKEPGANLALGQGMTAAFGFGNPTAEPHLYAGYPPGLPLLYGGYVWLAGLGPSANAFFELALEAVIVLLAYRLLSRAFEGSPGWQAWALAILMLLALPARYTLSQGDRPDAAGLALALLALFPGVGTSRRLLGAALLAGLAMTFSLFCGLLAVAGIALRWVLAPHDRRPAFWRTAALGALGCLLPLTLAVAVLTAIDPSYAARFVAFVSSTTTEVGGDSSGWWQVFIRKSDGLEYQLDAARPAIALIGGTLLLAMARARIGSTRAFLALGLLWATVVFSLAVVPWNKLYAGLAAGLLLPALAVALPASVWSAPRPRAVLLLALLLLLLPRLPLEGYRRVVQAGLGPSYERMTAFLAGHPLEDRTGDGAIWIAVDPQLYFLVKPLGHRVFVSNFWQVGPADFTPLLDYVALAYGAGGAPQAPRLPTWWSAIEPQLEPLYRPDLPQFVTLFGQRLSNSSYSWEAELWQRR